MARRRGWAQQFAPLAGADDVIGTLRSDLAGLTGLSPKVRIHAGLHDSNAALVAARGFAEIGGQEATVLSTGTWFVAMRSPAEPIDPAALPEARDCLVNVDVAGQPVPSSRWMGGRELELLVERIDVPGLDGLTDVLAHEAMVLPTLAPGCGPFPQAVHRWVNQPSAAPGRAAAAALYAALMVDIQLGLIGAKDHLLIEGRFAGSEIFTRALASLRPDTKVYVAGGEADVSFGALRLIWSDLRAAAPLQAVEPLPHDLTAYRHAWREQTDGSGR
jgi:sugar (pentulose or hexulose) kinase